MFSTHHRFSGRGGALVRFSGHGGALVAFVGGLGLGLGLARAATNSDASPADDGRRAAGWWLDHRAVRASAAVTVNRAPHDVHAFWSDVTNLPRFMGHLASVEASGPGRSRWRADGPLGTTVEWEAEVTEDRPGECIAWRSLPGADVASRGTVRFEPATGGRGTVVRVALDYEPPAGRLGVAVARLFGRAPDQEIRDDLRVLKQILETGAPTMSDAMTGRVRHPARPPAHTPPSRPVRGL